MTGLRLLLVGLLVVIYVLQIEAISESNCKTKAKNKDWYTNHEDKSNTDTNDEDNVKNFRSLVNETSFTTWFPKGAKYGKDKYTYRGLLMGVAATPSFCENKEATEWTNSTVMTANNCKKDVASFFGLVRQETGSLNALEEYDHENKLEEYDCKDNKNENGEGDLDCSWCDWENNKRFNDSTHYYGRGALQLSWNCNYGKASKDLLGDKNCLLQHPDLVKEEYLLWTTALWFWDKSLKDKDNFALQIKEINGDQECGPCPTEANKHSAHCRHYYMEIYAGKVEFTDEIAKTYATDDSPDGFKKEGNRCHDSEYSSHTYTDEDTQTCETGRTKYTTDDDDCDS